MRRKQLEIERQKQLEIERQKQAEIRRQKKLEIESQKQLEIERQRQAEKKRQIINGSGTYIWSITYTKLLLILQRFFIIFTLNFSNLGPGYFLRHMVFIVRSITLTHQVIVMKVGKKRLKNMINGDQNTRMIKLFCFCWYLFF